MSLETIRGLRSNGTKLFATLLTRYRAWSSVARAEIRATNSAYLHACLTQYPENSPQEKCSLPVCIWETGIQRHRGLYLQAWRTEIKIVTKRMFWVRERVRTLTPTTIRTNCYVADVSLRQSVLSWNNRGPSKNFVELKFNPKMTDAHFYHDASTYVRFCDRRVVWLNHIPETNFSTDALGKLCDLPDTIFWVWERNHKRFSMDSQIEKENHSTRKSCFMKRRSNFNVTWGESRKSLKTSHKGFVTSTIAFVSMPTIFSSWKLDWNWNGYFVIDRQFNLRSAWENGSETSQSPQFINGKIQKLILRPYPDTRLR